MTMISAVILLAASLNPQIEGLLPESEPAFVEVTRGRGSLLAGDATMPLSVNDGEQWVEGRGHLSIAASAKAVIRWHGRASIELYGPCNFEWESASPSSALHWSFKELRRASIEVRRHGAELKLGKNWHVSIPPGALELSSIPGHGYEVLQQAGSIAKYQWGGSRNQTRPELSGVIGTPLRLTPQASTSSDDRSPQLDGRVAWSWPWRNESQETSLWQRSDWPWIEARRGPTTILLKPAPPAPETAPKPVDDYVLVVQQPTIENEEDVIIVAEPEVKIPLTPKAEAPAEPDGSELSGGDGTWGLQDGDSELDDPWRGPSESGYERHGEYYVQKGVGIQVWQLPDGSVRFSLSDEYAEGGWVLGPRLDARLTPGGSVEYQPSGALKNHSGGVRVHAAIER